MNITKPTSQILNKTEKKQLTETLFCYDDEILKFFQDLDYFYNDPETNLKKSTIEQIKFYLKTDSYSSIDMQDNKGNTLLHYACQTQNNDWIFYLLEKQANPYIKNYDERTCFSFLDHDSQYYILDRYLKYSYTPRDFIESTKHLGQAFKESLLFNSKLSFHSIEETTLFLQQINIHKNKPFYYCYFIGRNVLLNTEEKINYYLSQNNFERTPENNSLFLAFVTESYRFNDHIENLADIIEKFARLPFEYNRYFTNRIYNLFSFFNKMNKNTDEQTYTHSVFFVETLMKSFVQHKDKLPQDCLYIINESSLGQYLLLKGQLEEKNGGKHIPHKTKI